MLKLLVVTPNPTVYDATVRIVQTTKFDAEVIQTTSRQVVEDVSKAMEGCTGIVVARGNQAQLLKKHVEYPRVGDHLFRAGNGGLRQTGVRFDTA